MHFGIHRRQRHVYSSCGRSTVSRPTFLRVTKKKNLSCVSEIMINQLLQNKNNFLAMCDSSVDVIRPLILGCETKQPKIIQICLASVQKVIEAKILNVV